MKSNQNLKKDKNCGKKLKTKLKQKGQIRKGKQISCS